MKKDLNFMNDITNREDIKLMVDTFYSTIRQDEILGPIFHIVIGNNWGKHLETMYNFWQTVLFHEQAYKGSPFMPHRKLPIGAKHFDRWLLHFNTSVDQNFEGKIADEAKFRAHKIAQMFQYKLSIKSFEKIGK